MIIKQLISVTALLAAFSAPTLAVTFEGALTQGSTVVTPYVGPDLLSFDIDFANLAAASIDFRIDSGDSLPIALSAVLRNFTGSGFTGYTLTLDKGSFAVIGSVTTPFGGGVTVQTTGAVATVSFASPEFLDTEIGNAYGTTAGAANWTLAGLQAGDRVNLSVTAVPEPGTYALLMAGLLAVAFVARRRG